MTRPDASLYMLPFRFRLGEAAWDRLVALGEIVEFPPGASVMARGHELDALYVVEAGELVVVDPRTSPPTVLDQLGPGDVIGEMSFVDGGAAGADIRVQTPTRCWRWLAGGLRDELRTDPALGAALYEALAGTLVQRFRNLAMAAMSGGLGHMGPAPDGDGQPDIARIAETMSSGLLASTTNTSDAGRPGASLGKAARWFAASGGRERATAVGARVRGLLLPWLRASRVGAGLLDRPFGHPVDEALVAHILAGDPAGEDAAGVLLDRALLHLDWFRGWRWRETEIARLAATGLAPDRTSEILMVGSGEATARGELARAAARGIRVTAVHLVPQGGVPSERLEGAVRHIGTSPGAFVGAGGPEIPAHLDRVIIDRGTELLPDAILAAVVAWGAVHLRSGGLLLLGHGIAGDDVALLDHLLGWPVLPRTPREVAALLPVGGEVAVHRPTDGTPAAIVAWTRP